MVGDTIPATNYTPPTSNVVYLSTTGNDANTGTAAQPKRTLFGASGAYAAVPSGGTIVVRGGVYEEGSPTAVVRSKACTIQAYPGEQPWFDGSVALTGWSGSGPWTKTGWTFNPGNTSGFTAGGVGDKPAVTYYLDQLFYDGAPLTQVTGTPGAGQFKVDHTTDTVTLGSNPNGHEVRMSRYRSLSVFGARVNFKGVGVRRYAGGVTESNTSIGVTSGYAALYWGGSSDGLVVENCTFADMARLALSITRPGATVTGCVFARSGQTHLNVGGEFGDGFTFTNNTCVDNNLAGFPREPGAAAIKIVKTDRSTVTDNTISGTHGCYGIWYDMHCTRATVARNHLTGNSTAYCAFLFELSGGGLLPLTGTRVQNWSYFVGNTIAGSWEWGARIFDSDYIKVWSNTVDECRVGNFSFLQDERPPNPFWAGTYNSGAVDMINSNIDFANNDLYGNPSASQVFAASGTEHPVPTDDCFSLFAGNWFDSAGARAAWWAVTPGSITSIPKVTAAEGAGALDLRSKFTANGWTNFRSASPPPDSARPTPPADVAVLLGTPDLRRRWSRMAGGVREYLIYRGVSDGTSIDETPIDFRETE